MIKPFFAHAQKLNNYDRCYLSVILKNWTTMTDVTCLSYSKTEQLQKKKPLHQCGLSFKSQDDLPLPLPPSSGTLPALETDMYEK